MNHEKRLGFRKGAWGRVTGGLVILMLIAGTGSVAAGPPEIMSSAKRQPPPDFSDRTVTFQSQDGITIEADFYPVKVAPGTRTPVAILIHMYPKDRTSWKAFVPKLRDKGIAVLAYDIRGTGGSTKPKSMKLAEGYQSKSPAHFTNASLDVLGALEWLGTLPYVDRTRVVLIGASIGCSISLDAATRTNDIKGIVCLSPGVDYFGVNSIAHIETCASYTPILLLAPEAEYEAVTKLIDASKGKALGHKYPGGREYHGTNMLDAPYGGKVRGKIVKFVMKSLGIKETKTRKHDAPAGDSGGKKHSKTRDKKSDKAKKPAKKD